MTVINTTLVKTLRELTGAGVLECKNALVAAKGNIALAVDNMRKAGHAKAAKKAARIAAEGIIVVRIDATCQHAVMVEVNCETDFVAKADHFIAFGDQVAKTALTHAIADLDTLRTECETARIALVAQVGENVCLRRLAYLTGGSLAHYLHDRRIGVLLAVQGSHNATLLKQIAMHIAASKPEYIHPQEIPASLLNRERQIQLTLAQQAGEPVETIEPLVQEQLLKFTSEMTLMSQPFIMEPRKQVGQLLQAEGITVTQFVRFEVGEGIEKLTHDFSTEVAEVLQHP